MFRRPVVLLFVLALAGVGAGLLLLQNGRKAAAPATSAAKEKNGAPAVIGTHDFSSATQATSGDAISGKAAQATMELQAMQQRDARKAPMIEKPLENTPSDFQGIGIELVRERKLASLPASTVMTGRPDVEQHIAKWLAAQFPEGYGIKFGRALAALGAISQPVDTIDLKAKFLAYQIGAWFDANDETLYVTEPVDDGTKRENALGLAYGNLFRSFGAEIFPDAKPLTTDARLARESLIAGDAALLRLLHSVKNPGKGGGGGVGEDPDDPSRAVPIPYFLRELELAPFGNGLHFAQSLQSLGGFDQLDAAYARPPVSCAEILNTKLYLAEEAFALMPISWPDVTISGKPPVWDDTLGVICLRLYLKQHVSESMAGSALSGWMNDRFLVYAADGKSRDHAVLQTRWKDAKSADNFFVAMQQQLASRYKNANDRSVALLRTNDGTGVLFIDAADAAFKDSAVQKLGDKK